ncbi:MAG TPA: ATP-dependent 6-phosphofructokinase [Candidatus Ozemobacteraceae bacterium]
MEINQQDFIVSELGEPKFESPLGLSKIDGDYLTNYVPNDERVLYNVSWNAVQKCIQENRQPITFERAGPREKIFFEPSKTKIGIVTCGGLCPGINDVIRALVMQHSWWYGVKTIYGFRYGYQGLIKEFKLNPIVLDPEMVSEIHEHGGTMLGSSRGPQDVSKMVDRLMDFDINILYCVGGDGTLRGALDIHNEIKKRGLPIGVVGIPKTIDNDINFIEKTFGFETAFSIAVESIRAAHVEAKGVMNGIGLVKLMGRDSGYIAANAAIASQDVNFCLVPELPFDLEGPNGFYESVKQRILRRGHAVIVVAEGVGQRLEKSFEKDKSGNIKFNDVGIFLRDGLKSYFASQNVPMTIKYIDPSYMIRSSKALPSDSVYCTTLAQNAAHAGMAGKTGLVVGIWNNQFTHIPIEMTVKSRKVIDPESSLWLNVIETTGQPRSMQNTQHSPKP